MKLKRKIMIGLLTVAGVASLTYGGYITWLMSPPPLPQTADQALALLQSPRFERLPEARQQDYYAHIGELHRDLSGDQRRQWWRSARENPDARAAIMKSFEAVAYQQARDYALAAPEDREAIFETMMQAQAKRMEEWRAQREARRSETPRENGEPREPRRAERPQRPQLTDAQRQELRQNWAERFQDRMEHRIENGNPQRQTLMAQYRKALRAYREEHGISGGWGGGGKGGGWGGGPGGCRGGGSGRDGKGGRD